MTLTNPLDKTKNDLILKGENRERRRRRREEEEKRRRGEEKKREEKPRSKV